MKSNSLCLTGALALAALAPLPALAHTDLSISLGLSAPPVYVEPAPQYYAPPPPVYYGPGVVYRDRDRDWHREHRHHERYEHEEHEEHHYH